jgi:hypothetical protein
VSNGTNGNGGREHHVPGGRYPDPRQDRQLVDAARAFKRENPHLKVLVHTGAVWFEDGGRHWGVYSRTIIADGPLVWCIGQGGTTCLHAPASDAPANTLEVKL